MEYSKEHIRKTALKLRQSLTREQVSLKSEAILNRLAGLEEYKKSSLVMLYADFRNEVATGDMIRMCIEDGKRTILPYIVRTDEGGRAMYASQIASLEELCPGAYGIYEPKESARIAVSPLSLDMVIVPGVAFDERRNRLGYGAGFYDCFLAQTRGGCCKAALAFEVQIFPSIPKGVHDVCMDMVVTEDRVIT
ncbi:5-formyltetrahydrofolate cyclo-ligase [Anaerobacterium chartisolvens]|uniref:5-formyltetrahydrofolate cyclo-ligase n=1 Tax=Anaerobacterium chartisolvens TaxID=1297424 RepID=A0A369AMA9_9FIRM|nr:5-formyltetrahydrofolate cyclo-ligase [Anaerobacterium chartisolvens]RCX10520.1 5-formyltetrahydrofolate cyclo-ligase [Anaerobacterium chartisolvens]